MALVTRTRNGRDSAQKPRATPKQKLIEQYFEELISQRVFKTRRQIAAACGTTDAGLSQVLRDRNRKLSVEQCLRLAQRVDATPAYVLRKAGRDDVAKVFEDLWPRDDRDRITLIRSERELVRLWREMTSKDRYHLFALITMNAERARAATAGHDGRGRAAKSAWPSPLKAELR